MQKVISDVEQISLKESKMLEAAKESLQSQPIDPALDLKRAMEELKIDPKDPNFSEEAMISQFQMIAEDPEADHMQRDRFAHLIKVLNKHKFWETQPIMQARQRIQKEGQIQ